VVISESAPASTDVLWLDSDAVAEVPVPIGGTAGQVLAKSSSTDYDTEWSDLPEEVVPVGGTAGQVLSKTSSTNYDMSWTTQEGYRFVQTLYYTSSGTFTKATYPWLKAIRVKVQGAGGGSGGVNVTAEAGAAASEGGAAGAYGERFLTDISSLASSVTVTVGAGGTAGAGSNQASGTSGGSSSFGDILAGGGSGGAHGFPVNSAFAAPFGAEGSAVASNCDVVFPGKNGEAPLVVNYSRLTFQGSGRGGNGGDSFLGRGGRPGNAAAGGVNVGVLGGGGGGRNLGNDGGSGSATGAAGGNGIVIVELYA
jgi:hypothetical protein